MHKQKPKMTQIVILNLGLEQLEAPIVIRQSGAFSFLPAQFRQEWSRRRFSPLWDAHYTENEHYVCEYKQRREHGVR